MTGNRPPSRPAWAVVEARRAAEREQMRGED